MASDWPERPKLTADRLVALAAVARLTLEPAQAARSLPQIEQIFGLLDALNAVPLGETVPASPFDPRQPD